MLAQIYQDVILEHYRTPRNHGSELENESVHVHAKNPSCGDELDLRLSISDDTITGLAFTGEGCAISVASTSIMTEAVSGQSTTVARDAAAQFRAMLRGEEYDDTHLGDGILFEGVSKLPVRVKCAVLGWMALNDALDEYERSQTSDEGENNE